MIRIVLYIFPATISRVSDIIDNDTGWWNVNLLGSFCAADIEVIKQIPLRGGDGPDRWVWHYTASGNYTVKSAYHFAVESTSSPWHHFVPSGRWQEDKKYWGRLWKFRTPKRALHFTWRFSTDSLPTTENLRRRTMTASSLCPLCPDDGDTTAHLFFECAYAREVWNFVGLTQKILLHRMRRGDIWFRTLLKTNDDEFGELLIMLCDGIWFQRNSQIFEQTHMSAREMTASVVSSLARFKSAQEWDDPLSDALLPGQLLRPHGGVNRCYFDAGICNHAATIGVCLVDDHGRFIRVMSRRIPNIQDPLLAESLALEEAILFAGDVANSAFVGDALHMINTVRGDEEPSDHCNLVISRIINLLDTSFFMGPFWVPRDYNHVAHALAHFAKSSTLELSTWVSPPIFLSLDSGRIPEP